MHNSVVSGCKENMQKLASQLAYPALLLDKDYRICYKNEFCLNRLIPLRMGSAIKNHLTASDFKRLLNQKSGETIRLSIEIPSLCGAFVYRGEDCLLVGLRTLTATLQNRMNELMQLNSDLTESILCQLSSLAAGNNEMGISELIKHKCNRIIRSQHHISEFLRIVNGIKNSKTRLCDVDAILDAIIPSLRDALRPLGIQITYNSCSDTLKSRCATLCEPDFNMILCLMIYNSIRISQSGKLKVDVNAISGKMYISILTDSVLPEKTARILCEGDLENENFSSPDSWIYFELLLIKRLCEYYFWDISVSAPGSDFSRFQITLSMPLEHENVSVFTVRSSESADSERKGLIATEFSDIFDEEHRHVHI